MQLSTTMELRVANTFAAIVLQKTFSYGTNIWFNNWEANHPVQLFSFDLAIKGYYLFIYLLFLHLFYTKTLKMTMKTEMWCT